MKYPPHSSKTQLLKQAQQKAKSLQADYDRLGVASTQNVRNSVPMWVLLLVCLPKRETHVTATVTIAATINGKQKQFEYTTRLPVGRFGESPVAGITVDEAVNAVQARGFMARRTTVAFTLSQLTHKGLIVADRYSEGKRTFCRYSLA